MLGHPIELRSTPDKGSMFAVAVPLAPAPLRADHDTAAVAPDDHPTSPATIVVIDDDAEVLAAARWLLESLGYRVMAAASIDEALAAVKARESIPDLIIADYRLPDGLTGPQAIERIRSELNARTPGLILTGDTTIGNLLIAGLATLHKPVSAGELGEAIRGLLKPPGEGG